MGTQKSHQSVLIYNESFVEDTIQIVPGQNAPLGEDCNLDYFACVMVFMSE